MKEMKLDRKEFNLLVNDILLYVKPVKLRISIANRLIEFFDKKQERIAELEEQLKNATKQVRKEVCDKIREWHDEECESLDLDSDFDVGYSGALSNLWGILDQIQESATNGQNKLFYDCKNCKKCELGEKK